MADPDLDLRITSMELEAIQAFRSAAGTEFMPGGPGRELHGIRAVLRLVAGRLGDPDHHLAPPQRTTRLSDDAAHLDDTLPLEP